MDIYTTLTALLYWTLLHHLASSTEYDSNQNITSPNYPQKFGENVDVIYDIFTRNHDPEDYLLAYLDVFDIVADPEHPDATSITITDHHHHVIGVYNTWAPPGVVTRVNRYGYTLRIRFISRSVKVNVTGFKMHFERKNSTDLVGPRETSQKSSGYVSSPGYPLYYPPDGFYVYTVITPIQDGVVQFMFKDIDLGDGAEVAIFDAASDGTPYLIYTFYNQQGQKWRYYLSGNVMTVVLKTGNNPTKRGFNLTYSEYCRVAGEELPCSLISYSAMTNVIIIVVSIAGIIAFVLLLVGCTIFFRK